MFIVFSFINTAKSILQCICDLKNDQNILLCDAVNVNARAFKQEYKFLELAFKV